MSEKRQDSFGGVGVSHENRKRFEKCPIYLGRGCRQRGQVPVPSSRETFVSAKDYFFAFFGGVSWKNQVKKKRSLEKIEKKKTNTSDPR